MTTPELVDMLARYALSPEAQTMSTDDAKRVARSGGLRVSRAQMVKAFDDYIDARIDAAIRKMAPRVKP
jgi:hypothetical protein